MTNTIQEAAALALHNAKGLVEQWFPGGTYDGDEYKPVNHVRGDSTPGSFHINTATGEWYDFADESARGKDLVSLYAYLMNLGQLEAARMLLKQLNGYEAPNHTEQPVKASKEQPAVPALYKIDPAMFAKRGEPSMVHEYKTLDGEIIGYTVRIEQNNDKVTLPLFCFKAGWQWRGFTGKDVTRPLYGLEKLNQHPKATVVVVEGEKCADVGQAVLDKEYEAGDYITISWMGGTSLAGKASWSFLEGRNIYIWPDNDEAGQKAARTVKEITGGRILHLPPDKPKGWDIADATSDEIEGVLNGTHSPKAEDGEIDYFNPYADNEYYKALGYICEDESESYYFLNKRTNNIVRFLYTHFVKDRLTQLAPEQFFADLLAGDNFNWSKVREHVYEASINQGLFDLTLQRGRGVWIDDKRVVTHLGESLLVDGTHVELSELDSRYVYRKNKQKVISENPLSNKDGNNLYEILHSLGWAHESQAILLAGWLFLAPICGALYWRPTVWITGEAGSGKSWVMNNIIAPVLNNFCLNTQGGSTEAGIRQQVKDQALAVIMDEAETENEAARKRLQAILELARQASSSSVATKFKGTISGKAISFNPVSMFLFSSIKTGMIQVSDISRVVELQLVKRDNHQEFEQLQNRVDNFITDDFSERFAARAIKMVPVVNESIKLFTKEIKKHHDNARVADIFGALLGGFWGLTEDTIPSPSEVECYVTLIPLNLMNSPAETTDHEEALAYLLESKIRVEINSKMQELNISELVNDAALGKPDANSVLGRVGLRVKGSTELQISNNHASLKKIFKDTPWSIRWNETFRNFSGAEKHDKPMYFGKGQKKDRGYTIPLAHCDIGGEFDTNNVNKPEEAPF